MGNNSIFLQIRAVTCKPKLGPNNDYLISVLVNFSCELGLVMTRYDLLPICQTSEPVSLLVILSDELRK